VAVAWLFLGDAWDPAIRLRMSVPLMNFDRNPLEIPLVVYFLFGLVLVVMGTSNGVNLTDGLDGLAIGPVIICSFTFMLLSYAPGRPWPGSTSPTTWGWPTWRGRESWRCSAGP
jgi:phospho-N-acetylmuramoyl-pentapeptide-transferase